MKIIGAGFGRTGTLSLKVALEELGCGPCYHMQEIMMNHHDHAKIWHAAARGETVDWHTLFTGFQSTVDFPSHPFYKELMEVYPNAKVLLSVRNPENWYESTKETIYQMSTVLPKWMRLFIPWMDHILRCDDILIWKGLFHDRFEDKAFAIQVFKNYNAEVQRIVPADKLLVFDVKEGWEPLCTFLDVPVPDKRFPHVNDRAEMQERIRKIRRVSRLAPALAGGLAVGLTLLIRIKWPPQ